MAALWEKSFCVLEYHTSKSVVTVQRAFHAKYAKDLPTRPRWPKAKDHCSIEEYRCTHVDARVGQELQYRIAVWRVTVVHTSNISGCQNNFFSFPVAVNNSIKVGPLVFLL